MILGICPDILDLLDFTVQAVIIGDPKNYLVFLLKIFQIFLPFFRLLVLFHSLSPTSHISSYSTLDGTIGARASAVLCTMRHILSLKKSCLLANFAMSMGNIILRRLYMGTFVGSQDTSTILLLPRDPDGSVAVI